MAFLAELVSSMFIPSLSCVNCGIDYTDAVNGDYRFLDDTELVRWRRTKGYVFCSDGCEAVYMDFVKEYGHGN